jgi:hypothetical protein
VTLTFGLPGRTRGTLRLEFVGGAKGVTDAAGTPFSSTTVAVSLTPALKQ